MKKFEQEAQLLGKFEKDHPENFTGMQMRIWSLNNGTDIIVRLYKHDPKVSKKLFDGKRVIRDVEQMILSFLYIHEYIKAIDHWGTSPLQPSTLDEYEEKDDCIYFCWRVKADLLKF